MGTPSLKTCIEFVELLSHQTITKDTLQKVTQLYKYIANFEEQVDRDLPIFVKTKWTISKNCVWEADDSIEDVHILSAIYTNSLEYFFIELMSVPKHLTMEQICTIWQSFNTTRNLKCLKQLWTQITNFHEKTSEKPSFWLAFCKTCLVLTGKVMMFK